MEMWGRGISKYDAVDHEHWAENDEDEDDDDVDARRQERDGEYGNFKWLLSLPCLSL